MARLPLFNSDIWQEFEELKPGVKKLILGERDGQKVSYFKALSRRPGPIAANEYITYRLGTILQLPIAPIQLIKFGETDGYLSLEIGNSNPWQAFPNRENSKQFLDDESIFAKIITFDMWVRQQDRHDTNLVFQPRPNQKYELYMIDNESCLYSIDAQPPSSFDDFSGIIKIKEMARQLTGIDELTQQAQKITEIQDSAIIEIVDNFLVQAPTFLNETQAKIIKDLLLRRKSILKDKIAEWYNSTEWRQ